MPVSWGSTLQIFNRMSPVSLQRRMVRCQVTENMKVKADKSARLVTWCLWWSGCCWLPGSDRGLSEWRRVWVVHRLYSTEPLSPQMHTPHLTEGWGILEPLSQEESKSYLKGHPGLSQGGIYTRLKRHGLLTFLNKVGVEKLQNRWGQIRSL